MQCFLPQETNLVVVCGKNEKVQAKLKALGNRRGAGVGIEMREEREWKEGERREGRHGVPTHV